MRPCYSNADGLTDRTIRQLLLTVRNSAAVLDMTGYWSTLLIGAKAVEKVNGTL